MINLHTAIYALNSNIVSINNDIAYDINNQEVAYNKADAEAKLTQLQAEETTKQQAEITAKASAQAKLSALGLTADEVKAILGTT